MDKDALEKDRSFDVKSRDRDKDSQRKSPKKRRKVNHGTPRP